MGQHKNVFPLSQRLKPLKCLSLAKTPRCPDEGGMVVAQVTGQVGSVEPKA